MRACAHRRRMKQHLPHAPNLFFLSRLCARRALRCGWPGRGCSAAIPGAAAGRAIVRRALASLVSDNCARAVADHVPRCCGAQRASTAVDAEQALTLDRRLVPMPTRLCSLPDSDRGRWMACGGCCSPGALLYLKSGGAAAGDGRPPGCGPIRPARSLGDKSLKLWDNSSGKIFLIGGEPLHRSRVCGVRWCFDLEAPRGISKWPEPAGRRALIRNGPVDVSRQKVAARDAARAWHEAGPRALAASSIPHFRPAGFD